VNSLKEPIFQRLSIGQLKTFKISIYCPLFLVLPENDGKKNALVVVTIEGYNCSKWSFWAIGHFGRRSWKGSHSDENLVKTDEDVRGGGGKG